MDEIVNRLSIVMTKYNVKFKKEELENVSKYAYYIYKDKKRKSKKSVLEHTLGVAEYVASLKLDDSAIYAALLHEVIKYPEYDEKAMEKVCKKEVIDMINTISKLSYFNFRHNEKVDKEILRKMFIAIAKDIRTVIIKLADRLYNMQNISEVDEKTANQMAKECLDIYAPIAHRLGMSKLKAELEDISFRIIYPEQYQEIKRQIDKKKSEREAFIKDRIEEINKETSDEKIEATVYGRPKHFYSIYKKMKQKGCMAEDLFDLLAIRIIVNSIKDCYSALGIVHDMYKPMPGRFKDYIAVPKTNMYQSLHTTVFGTNSVPFEIQIRTWDMDNIAEEGIAAHFSYKEKTSRVTDADKKLLWIRKALELQQELSDTTENMNKMKTELFGEEVFVFTPKGEIKSFPKGSTPIDFAYSIHQKVAEKMIGAKVNSKMVPLNTILENTDIVEVVTSQNAKGPSRDWLKYVKTSAAKSKISGFLKKQGKDVNIQQGKQIFEKYLRKQKVSKDELLKEKYLDELLKFYSFKTINDCYENIGFGSVSALKVINKLNEIYKEKNKEINGIEVKNKSSNTKIKNTELVVVEDIPNCKVQFSKCCNPIPGDDIIGYITNSNGVSVHTKDCKNILKLLDDSRKINVTWAKSKNTSFSSKIVVMSNNRSNILTDVIKCLNDMKVNIEGMNSKTTQDKENIMEFTLNISDENELQKIIKNIKKVDSVFEVKRVK